MLTIPFGFFATAGDVEPVTENLIINLDKNDISSYDPDVTTQINNNADSAPAGLHYELQNDVTSTTQAGVDSLFFDQSNSSTYGRGISNSPFCNNEIAELTAQQLADDFSFEFGYYRPAASTNENVSIFSIRHCCSQGGISRPGYAFRATQLAFYGIASYSFTSTTTSLLTADNWHIVAGAASGTSLNVYVNGSFTETITISSTRPNVGGTVPAGVIGSFPNSCTTVQASLRSYYFNFFRLYDDKQLTAAEVLQNYNAKKGDLGLS